MPGAVQQFETSWLGWDVTAQRLVFWDGADWRYFETAIGLATAADLTAGLSTRQPIDPDLTAIAGLTPADDDVLQRKAGAWTNRTMAELLADIGALPLAGGTVTGGLGIGGAAPDDTNKLAVSSEAVLLDNAGAGIQLKLNKAADTDDAALLLQTGFSARALIGLLGSDDFTFKVSPDGSSFFTALSIDKDTGHVGLAGATADAGNALIVAGENVLFANGDGALRFTFSKHATADDAALTFETDFSARALIGLLGDDNFTFKVSPDGSSFLTSFVLDKASGAAAFAAPFGAPPAFLTIASDALTIASSYVVPAPESGTADDLATINGGFDGALLVLSGTAGNTITLKDGTGNLKLAGDFALDNFDDTITLIKRGTTWLEIARSNNG